VDLKKKNPNWKKEPVAELTEAIATLKSLLAKQKAGGAAAPAAAKVAPAAKAASGANLDEELAAVKAKVVALKKANPTWQKEPVAELTEAIATLKSLLAKQKAAASPAPAKSAAKAPAKKGGASSGASSTPGAVVHKKKSNVLAIQSRKELSSFADWYAEVIFKAQLVSSYPISGCYVLRPTAYALWESVQRMFDGEIKQLGVRNVYFPMFVPEEALMREKDHVEGFSPEVAWITKYGSSDLAKKIAVRPTSETVMYPTFAEWVSSHRDLPLQVNQWCNVVRWEFKSPMPFIRTREFLWQEGHTVHATRKAAVDEVYTINQLYANVYTELFAVPVVRGKKSDKEKFAGADFTTTVEIYAPVVGRGIQGATSHHLGQNFSKMFNIEFLSSAGTKEFAHQNSWGLSTRSIGAMILVHSDDRGLVLPPRAAPTQVVLIPIVAKNDDRETIVARLTQIYEELKDAGIRAVLDLEDGHTPGFKRSKWELRGVPVRLELGPKDMAASSALACRRDTGAKSAIAWTNIASSIGTLLETIQSSLYERALATRDESLVRVESFDAGFMDALNNRNIVLAPWCDTVACEEAVGKRTKEEATETAEQLAEGADGGDSFEVLTGAAKTLCIPFKGELSEELLALKPKAQCFACKSKAKVVALWGRSY
jgi:prolyl-tRNA synthetase